MKADISHFTRARTYFCLGLFSFFKTLSFLSIAHYSNLEATVGKDGMTWFLEKNHHGNLEENRHLWLVWNWQKNSKNNKCGSSCSSESPAAKCKGSHNCFSGFSHATDILEVLQSSLRLSKSIIREFFTIRTIGHWNNLPKEAVDSAALDAFKTHLDRVLGHLV